jgi:hypothetical protein
VTKDDIKRVANKYLSKENRLVVYYLPKSEEGNKTDVKPTSTKPTSKSAVSPSPKKK